MTHPEPAENYAALTTKMEAAQTKLGWALRDKQYAEAKKLLAEIMTCAAALNRYIESRPRPPCQATSAVASGTGAGGYPEAVKT